MEQKDYILREIEKIGLLLSALRHRLFGGKDNLAINIEKQTDEARGMLFNELNFDLDKLIDLQPEETYDYLCTFKGFNDENTENLAEILYKLAINGQPDSSKKYFEKALQLYEICNLKSKTFSFERERKIAEIRSVLL